MSKHHKRSDLITSHCTPHRFAKQNRNKKEEEGEIYIYIYILTVTKIICFQQEHYALSKFATG